MNALALRAWVRLDVSASEQRWRWHIVDHRVDAAHIKHVSVGVAVVE
jgi:hypothetical protein